MMFGKSNGLRIKTIIIKDGVIAGLIRSVKWNRQENSMLNLKNVSNQNSRIIKDFRPNSGSIWKGLSQISKNRTIH